jgi:hypothetical protein
MLIEDLVQFFYSSFCFGLCCLLEEEGVFCILQRGLVWAGFVEQALERFLDASVNVTVRLPKARMF